MRPLGGFACTSYSCEDWAGRFVESRRSASLVSGCSVSGLLVPGSGFGDGCLTPHCLSHSLSRALGLWWLPLSPASVPLRRLKGCRHAFLTTAGLGLVALRPSRASSLLCVCVCVYSFFSSSYTRLNIRRFVSPFRLHSSWPSVFLSASAIARSPLLFPPFFRLLSVSLSYTHSVRLSACRLLLQDLRQRDFPPLALARVLRCGSHGTRCSTVG